MEAPAALAGGALHVVRGSRRIVRIDLLANRHKKRPLRVMSCATFPHRGDLDLTSGLKTEMLRDRVAGKWNVQAVVVDADDYIANLAHTALQAKPRGLA
jgi:hypothetical protein